MTKNGDSGEDGLVCAVLLETMRVTERQTVHSRNNRKIRAVPSILFVFVPVPNSVANGVFVFGRIQIENK